MQDFNVWSDGRRIRKRYKKATDQPSHKYSSTSLAFSLQPKSLSSEEKETPNSFAVMLSFSLLALASVASFATAVPSDQSGTAQFALSCSGITVPDVVAQSGTSYFTSSLKFFPDGGDGDAIPATACTDESSTCSNCLFEGGGLSSPTNVTGCWNP